MTRGRKTGIAGLLLAAAILAGGAAAQSAGVSLNTTPSLPMGLWLTTAAPAPLRVHQVVAFCPPATAPFELAYRRDYLAKGACPSGFEQMLKPIVALAGDTVTISPAGIAVDGALIPSSRPLLCDSNGRALQTVPDGTYQVTAGEMWLVSSFNPRSYDSRYFGPVPTSTARATARPLLTDKTP
jgi:conjugative transfer signal peptidase TraF